MSDPATGHLDLDALADLLAGELPTAELDAATAHVGSCDRCSEALSDLDAALVPVAAQLAAAPLPPVPADLEATLLARLAAEPAPAAAAGPEVPAGPRAASDDVLPGGVVPLRPRASSRRGPGVLGVAAGAVGLLAVAGLGLGLARGGSDLDGASSAGSGGGEASVAAPLADLPAQASGTDYRPDGGVFARALPGLLGSGAAEAQAAPPAAAEQTTGGTAGGTSGGGAAGGATDGGSAGSTTSGSSALSGNAGAAADTAARATTPDPLARLRDPAQLAGCLAELSGPDSDGVPLALDYATYQGQPALVVVLPSAREGKVDVFAVGAGCRAGDDRTLYFTRLDRP